LRNFFRDYGVLAAPLGYLAIFFIAPLVLMIVISFWQARNYHLIPDFSFDNYREALTAPLNRQVLLHTIWVAVAVTVLAALIGYPSAYFLAQKTRRFRNGLLVLVILPLWTSYLIRTFAWIPILSRNGALNQLLQILHVTDKPVPWFLYSPFAVIIALVGIYLPYLVLPCYAVLEKIDKRVFEAARDLGAGPLQMFWKILLPLSAPGIVVGMLFVFILAAGSYITPALLGGPNGTLIGQRIAVQFVDLGNQPLGSAMSLVLIGLILIISTTVLRRYSAAGVN
jgi:spermidine/putrescine transport system permease protein